MVIDDFVMLGTTVPEPNSDGRVFVCSAGVSEEYQSLIRIYPLARRNAPRRWAMHRIPLERNRNDSRRESFQIAGNRQAGAHQWINHRFETVKEKVPEHSRAELLRRYVVGSIQEANAKRLSLAVVQPESIELDFQYNSDSASSPQLTLFDTGEGEPTHGARRFAWMPRLKFQDECGSHNLMLRDWGVFELQRKHEERYFLDNLEGALSLRPSSSLLIGNMNNQRNVWLVISVLNGVRREEDLFDSLRPDPVSIPSSLRLTVLERDEWCCAKCGTGVSQLTVQTRSPRRGIDSALAQNDLETICAACLDGDV